MPFGEILHYFCKVKLNSLPKITVGNNDFSFRDRIYHPEVSKRIPKPFFFTEAIAPPPTIINTKKRMKWLTDVGFAEKQNEKKRNLKFNYFRTKESLQGRIFGRFGSKVLLPEPSKPENEKS